VFTDYSRIAFKLPCMSRVAFKHPLDVEISFAIVKKILFGPGRRRGKSELSIPER
jgi:hypothetical protein